MLSEIRILESMQLFKDLSPEELEKIARLLHLVKFNKGDILIQEGDVAKNFFIILTGEYKIAFPNENFLSLNKKGNFIGWSTIIAGHKYLGTGTALTDGEALKLSGQDFIRLLRSDADLGNKIMANGSHLASKKRPFARNNKQG